MALPGHRARDLTPRLVSRGQSGVLIRNVSHHQAKSQLQSVSAYWFLWEIHCSKAERAGEE